MTDAINGLVDDLEKASGRIFRPKDAQGNQIPFADVGIAMDPIAIVGIAAAIAGGVAGGAMLAKMLTK